MWFAPRGWLVRFQHGARKKHPPSHGTGDEMEEIPAEVRANLTDAEKLSRIYATLAHMQAVYGGKYSRALYAAMLSAEMDLPPFVAEDMSAQASFSGPTYEISQECQHRTELAERAIYSEVYERYQSHAETMDFRAALELAMREHADWLARKNATP